MEPLGSLTPCRLTARKYSSVKRYERGPPWLTRTVYHFRVSVTSPPAEIEPILS
jgi:hypothetical protein